jgi:hypothetical protein
MYNAFHLEVRTETLNAVYMNLEHNSLSTWKYEVLLKVACHIDQYCVVYGCYSEQFHGYRRTV